MGGMVVTEGMEDMVVMEDMGDMGATAGMDMAVTAGMDMVAGTDIEAGMAIAMDGADGDGVPASITGLLSIDLATGILGANAYAVGYITKASPSKEQSTLHLDEHTSRCFLSRIFFRVKLPLFLILMFFLG